MHLQFLALLEIVLFRRENETSGATVCLYFRKNTFLITFNNIIGTVSSSPEIPIPQNKEKLPKSFVVRQYINIHFIIA